MKTELLKDYLINGKLNIDKVIDDFYGYVYIIVKNGVSDSLSNEDIEEIISDVFVAIWKISSFLPDITALKPYLSGISKNIIKNKYRKLNLNASISDYEEKLISNEDIEKITEENEQNKLIKETLCKLKNDEYKIFMMFYYEAKSIKEIAQKLKFTESKVKVVLHRVRKIIKKNLEDGGYSYGR